MSRTYWAQGYTEGETEIYHMEVPDGAKGPYTFDVEVYSNDVSHLGYQPMWEGASWPWIPPDSGRRLRQPHLPGGYRHRPGGGRRAQRGFLWGAEPRPGGPGGEAATAMGAHALF
ncbi:MAG: hypothetical protein ACLRNQ_15310 [Flavonifractor plautii]